MTQKDKDLLLKDLFARLPYNVKVQYKNNICSIDTYTESNKFILIDEKRNEYPSINDKLFLGIEEFKPYLFPLSSMTKEQSMEFALLQVNTHKDGFLYVCDCANMMKWLLKNHFDIYGLIEKGLAIDATGKNIYQL